MKEKDMQYEKDKLIGENIYQNLKNDLRFDLNACESLTINYKNKKEKNVELIIKKGYCVDINVGTRKMDNIENLLERLVGAFCFVGDSVETLLKYQPYDMIESIVLQYGNKKMTIEVEQIFEPKAGDGDD